MTKPAPHHHIVTCLNCGNRYHGSFCNSCGQDAHAGKIDRHFVYHELQHALFHIDKGILYTLRTLFAAPGRTIKSFIEGHRVKHFKPLTFVIVIAGLYAFVNHFFNHTVIVSRHTGIQIADNSVELVNEYLKEYFEWFILIQLPLIAWIYFAFFRKYGTNYIEQLVICAYVTGMRTLISILLLPVSTYYPVVGYWAESLIPIILFCWTYLQYYTGKPKAVIITRVIMGYASFYVLVLILLSVLLTLVASI